MHYIEGSTAGTGGKKKRRDCNDMLPVLEWVFVPVNQPSFRAGGVNGGAKLALMQQLQITVL